MRTVLICALSTLALTVLSPFAHATSSVGGNGLVLSVGVQSNSTVATVTISNAVGTATCGTLGTYSIDVSTAQGKAMYSLMEGAMLAGKRVGLGGSTSCLNGNEVLGIVTAFSN